MKRTTLIAVACAALIAATGFAAAAPGNAPASVDTGADSTGEQHANDRAGEQHANDRAADEQRGNHSQNQSERGAAAGGADERNGQGPSVDLPDQVPDHVSAIHDRISSFLSGDLAGSLGDAISELTPGDDGDAADDETDADGSQGNSTADESQTNTTADGSQANGDEQPDDGTQSGDSSE